MKKFLLLLTVIGGLVAFSVPAQALILELDYEFSGATEPESPTTPWLKATFEGTGTVSLTLEAPNLTDAEHVKVWCFNFYDPGVNVSDLVITQTSGEPVSKPSPTTYATVGDNHYKADGDGWFDIVFSWDNGVFTDDEQAAFTLSYTGITPDNFDYFSSPGGGAGTWQTAAHIGGIGIGPDDQYSGWIGGGGQPVPEPATMLLLGTGLIGLAGVSRRKFKKS